MTALTVTVLGVPVPQGSMKSLGPRRMVHSNAEKLRPWRDAVAWHLREEMTAAGMTEPWDEPVVVTATFVLPRPQSAAKRRWAPDRKPDIDKLLRAALDALTASGVVVDDARVVHVEMSKVYGQPQLVLSVGPATLGEQVSA
jgi:Holliday junction resolvase RusA-like endonuclease